VDEDSLIRRIVFRRVDIDNDDRKRRAESTKSALRESQLSTRDGTGRCAVRIQEGNGGDVASQGFEGDHAPGLIVQGKGKAGARAWRPDDRPT